MNSSVGRQRYRFAPVWDRKHCRVKKRENAQKNLQDSTETLEKRYRIMV